MRQLQEIDKDIEAIDQQIFALNRKKKALTTERYERVFADFCEQHNIKSGDIVELNNYKHTQVQVVGMDIHYAGWVRCNKVKKNGEPYKNLTIFLPKEFEGCKVIKTTEE